MEGKAGKLLDFISSIEPLKYVTRHSWCSNGRQESVAEHAWRMASMAVLLEEEFPEIDIKKVLEMCLLHDLGETDGDIPAFEKSEDDDNHEFSQLEKLTQILPLNMHQIFFEEIRTNSHTEGAKISILLKEVFSSPHRIPKHSQLLNIRCEYCGKQISESYETEKFEGIRHYFCCTSCLRNYKKWREAQVSI